MRKGRKDIAKKYSGCLVVIFFAFLFFSVRINCCSAAICDFTFLDGLTMWDALPGQCINTISERPDSLTVNLISDYSNGVSFPGSIWQMKQCDMHNTGRADYTVPENRINDTFFDIFLWQKPSPGPLSSTSMVYYDGAGPEGKDIVIAGYHWPKGVQGMDRHNGAQFWTGNPSGGETIGTITPAFSNDGSVVYVTNDATPGHPLMAFETSSGPSSFWHNGEDPNPNHLSMRSPTIAPDGRIFLHAWGDRPYGGMDSGTDISEIWDASTVIDSCYSDPALYADEDNLIVVSGGRWGIVCAYDGETGAEMWNVHTGAMMDASLTIDPANGNIYVGAGDSDIYIIGLNKNGLPLWGSASKCIYDYVEGTNNPQRAQSTGCLSHDGTTYYFQTNSREGDGRLYAVNTLDGMVKWSFNTGSRGWEMPSSSPIITQNNILIVGNNEGDTYYAIKDAGLEGILIDTLTVDPDGNARASATISSDGLLYLPLRICWISANGDCQTPIYQVENLFTAIDLSEDAFAELYPPKGVVAVALNNAVEISWQSILDPTGRFAYYAVYRSTTEITSVEGLTPIGIVPDINTTSYLDTTADNGTSYYYVVTVVAVNGDEITEVTGVGPRTPRDETDMQVVSISRTPRYPRYAPMYTYYEITEPSGFGPYIFSAATGLGNDQTPETQRWPDIGDPVTYTATLRNRGTNICDEGVTGRWRVDGAVVDQQTVSQSVAPGDTIVFTTILNWDGQSHQVGFTIDLIDQRSENNTLAIDTKSVPFLSYIDVSYIEDFREVDTPQYPSASTNDIIDWLNYHMARFNEMFAAAGCQKRVHYDLLEVLNDHDADPDVDRQPFAIFPFRFYAGDPSCRQSGYYRPDEDIDYGLLHEMGHQLGLIDLYQLDVPADWNDVSGLGYSGPDGLMHSCSDFISEHSALAMNHWLNKVHGYYGQYLYNIPSELRLRVLDYTGQPLPGATVKMYQYCERPGQGKVITDQIKAQGVTGANGEFLLPNVPVDPAKVPPICTDDELHDNPFGYLAVVGTNGVLLFSVEYEGNMDYAWFDITEANILYFSGQTNVAVFERQLNLGGPPQYCPPEDLAELNANDWDAWAQGSTATNTYVADDTVRKIAGDASVKFVTDGGFDTYVRYPRTFSAHWDLSSVDFLKISFYAENSNIGFQGGSPWLRLKDAENNYFEYQYYRNGNPFELLNEARDTWQSYQIPLNASPATENGWRRTTTGSPDLSHMQYLEIHADTWDFGFTLWIDGIGFDPQPPCPCNGDYDYDGDVDGSDLAIFSADYGRTDCDTDFSCEGDFDNDGDVDGSDLVLFAEDLGRNDCPVIE